jgi:hypothetical protein
VLFDLLSAGERSNVIVIDKNIVEMRYANTERRQRPGTPFQAGAGKWVDPDNILKSGAYF